MKKLIFLIITGIKYNLLLYGQDLPYKPISDCSNYNSFLTSGAISSLNYYADTILQNGTIIFDEFKASEFGSFNSNYSKFNLNNDYTFQFERETPSRFDENYSFKRYQQYYKGVKVDGGGYSIKVKTGPDNPCGPTAAIILTPFLLTNISINTDPIISQQQALQVVDGISNNNILTELAITHNLLNSCEYILTYKLSYEDGNGNWVAWIDAKNGGLIKKVNLNLEINAPTEIYGQQNLNDRRNGNQTILETPDRNIRVYNFTAFPDCVNRILGNFTANLVPTTNGMEWTNQDAPIALYQNFFVASNVGVALEGIGINFDIVHCGVNCPELNAFSINAPPHNDAFIVIGGNGTNSFGTFDVIAHELAHSYLRRFIGSESLGNGSLHEGISDMIGSYIESLFQNNGIDWVMGDDVPDLANLVNRNLQNPNFRCFNDVQNRGPHDRSEPLSHWYFLISNGSNNQGITGIGSIRALQLVLEAVSTIGRNSDYQQIREATLAIARTQFGVCSNEYLSILRAWNAIWCEQLSSSPCQYSLNGPNSVCEEDDHFKICVSGGLSNAHYNWTIIGPSSTDYKSRRGMQGNSQIGGECLDIIDIPKYPYYPQYITIEVYSPTVGVRFKQKKQITIVDCNGDDPTCEEYYGQKFTNHDHRSIKSNFNNASLWQATNMKIINLDGKTIYSGKLINSQLIEESKIAKMLIYFYFDQYGNIVETRKVFGSE